MEIFLEKERAPRQGTLAAGRRGVGGVVKAATAAALTLTEWRRLRRLRAIPRNGGATPRAGDGGSLSTGETRRFARCACALALCVRACARVVSVTRRAPGCGCARGLEVERTLHVIVYALRTNVFPGSAAVGYWAANAPQRAAILAPVSDPYGHEKTRHGEP